MVRSGSEGGARDQGKVEVVEAPSRMIVGLYCFLPGSQPVCRRLTLATLAATSRGIRSCRSVNPVSGFNNSTRAGDNGDGKARAEDQGATPVQRIVNIRAVDASVCRDHLRIG